MAKALEARNGASGVELREASVRSQPRLTIIAAENVRAAVIAGQGLAISLRCILGAELASGEVVSVLNKWRLRQWSFG